MGAVGQEPRESFRSWADRRGEKFHRLCPCAEGVPRRVYGILHANSCAVPRSGAGTRRRKVPQSARATILFKQAPDKPSELYLKAQIPPPSPTVSLAGIRPVRPTIEALPAYPPIARAARVSGVVAFTLEVTADGRADKFQVTARPPAAP